MIVTTGVIHDLTARMAQADERTQELISQGFVFAGKVFSLSLPAQSYWTNMYQARAIFTATGGYPLHVNTLDDSESFSVPDEATVEGMYQTALGTVQAHLASGTQLKDSLRAAVDQAALDAIEDTR